ncbi:flagellar hook-basal body complex protein FliE [Siminovitchia sp. 179-K 8D1 HS]|uniref:flagellar hook-basal body complex protein FliE n=1 Tax=Siminovitchia sp. 179-K 8D1 HS TaxID=3142385 RepID=UPI0039A152DC
MEVHVPNSKFIDSFTADKTNKPHHDGDRQNGFGTYLKDALNEVNKLQLESDLATKKLALGEQIQLHEVMIAGQKASISIQAALEIRNKAVEAYQEIMRMQV